MKLFIISNNLRRASFRQRIEIYRDMLDADGIDCETVLYPRGNFARWKVLRRCREFDAVLLHKKTLNIFDAFWLRRYSRKVIYSFDDAIMYYDVNPQRKPHPRKHTRPFERTIRLSAMVIAGNEYLAEHARRFNDNVEVLPTGLGVDDYRADGPVKQNGNIRLVWIGSKSTLKYLAGLTEVFEEIGRRYDNVVLRIICDEFFDLANLPVEKRQWSLQQQGADLSEGDIGLAPLPDNRFTRGKCGFKILQYAASGLATVASPVGFNSVVVSDGVNGFLADDPGEWIDKLTELIENPELRVAMGRQARRDVQRYDLGIIGEKFVKLIRRDV